MRKLEGWERKPTNMSLQHAYMLVRVDNFLFPVDFVIINIEEDDEVPLILERSFLQTGRDLIDVE